MQKVWNVIQGALVSGASISVMAWALNEVSQKPIAVNDSKPVDSVETQFVPAKVPQQKVEPNDDDVVVVDVPIPAGRVTGITQTVDVVGGKIVSARVTFDK